MKIEFVSHAGFITEVNGKKIFSDPWTTGKVFNDSWSLYTPAAIVDFGSIHYIFVSHEHPDHFNFPTLKNIPSELRKKIAILYQKHASTRLADNLQKLGFKKTIELPLYKWKEVEGIKFYCGSVGSMDSFLAIRDSQNTLLNLNDCALNSQQYQYIKREIQDVDIMLTQFSFANFVGNEKDEFNSAEKKIRDVKHQIEIFKPKYTIPFASFVYFCNQENSRMNEWSNTPQKIYDMHLGTIFFMYPGDQIDLTDPVFKSKSAVTKYMSDLGMIKIEPTPPQKSFEEILNAVEANLNIFRKKILFPFRLFVKPFGIYFSDLNKGIMINANSGTIQSIERNECRYVMCSQVGWYTFNFSWGTGTLDVSGMFIDLQIGQPTSRYFFFQNVISTEFISFRTWRQSLRTIHFFWRKKWEIFYRLVGST